MYTLQHALSGRAINDFDLEARTQRLQEAAPAINFCWSAVQNLMIGPKELLLPKNKPFMYVSFEYPIQCSPYAVAQKISIKLGTFHFRELISLN